MWSSQAEAGNKNMTSLKSKITHRKRKNSKSKAPTAQSSDGHSATNIPKKPHSGRNRKNSTGSQKGGPRKCKAAPDLIEDLKPASVEKEGGHEIEVDTTCNGADVTQLTNGAENPADFRRGSLSTDVRLQDGENAAFEALNNNVKRYSDSFVINGGANDSFDEKSKPCDSLRTQSERFVVESLEGECRVDKAERKSRRFSDIFRYGALKPSTSCESLKSKMMRQHESCYEDEEFPGVHLRRKPIQQPQEVQKREAVVAAESTKKHKKGLNRTDSKLVKQDSEKSKGKKVTIHPQTPADTKKGSKTTPGDSSNDSYLKRVKSKIYKNKSDNNSNNSNGYDTLPSMPNIAENSKSSKKSKKKKSAQTKNAQEQPPDHDFAVPELRKAVSQFDFRLIRQTSNLERIRPKTFGLRTSSSNLGIPELIDGQVNNALNMSSDKPILAKSKSSSAINLNLLRTRRNKLLEQAKRNCKIVQNEFDFIAFGAVRSAGVQVSRKFGNQTLTNSTSAGGQETRSATIPGETKPGHPVSRTGSDRRPDAVREESSRTQESQDSVDHETDTPHQDSTVSLPAYPGNKKRTSTNINRSESVKEQSEKRKQRRNISDPLHNTTHETVDLDQQGLSYQTNSGSSSNSSLSSSRSSESPSTSLDAVSGFAATTHPAGSGWDSDMEVEADPPDWQSSVPDEELASLHPHEKKRQDVINELFHTERSHLRNLRVLDYVFRKPLQSSKLLKNEDINLIFPNLNDLLEIHSHLNTAMKSRRKETPIVRDIGDMLINMFDGAMGETFQSSAAAFCERQQLALEFIKERRKKDSRFDGFLSECEKNNLCRRLPLQGILPTEMQRLSKYPLLLERLIDSEEKNKQREPELAQAELVKLRQAHDRSKEILNFVNEAAKIACNRARLEDIQRHLDTSIFEKTDHPIVNEFKNLDLTRYSLIHEGTMHLRRPTKQPVSLHIVLLEEAVILLQKDAERYVLKFFQTGTPNQLPLAPIIKTSTLLVRANAASKSSLFLVNTSSQNSQMYDLMARDSAERDTWFKHISDAADAYNRREGKSKRSEPTPDAEETETLQDLPSARDVSERAEPVGGDVASAGDTDSSGPSGENSNSDVMDEDRDKRLSQSDGDGANTNEVTGGGLTLKLAADDWPLVQPTEVHVAVPPVHTAEPVLTPIEQIRRKDEEVRRALADKEGLVADLLSIPREDYQLIADIASEEAHNKGTSDREPSELVLAAVFQADQLLQAVNDSLNISEADAVLATGGRHASCASNENAISRQNNHFPSVPVHRLQEIATTLSTQLTTLLSVIKQRDEERDRLRKELQRTREQLHERLSLHGPQNTDADFSTVDSTQSGDLESIEESLTENENN